MGKTSKVKGFFQPTRVRILIYFCLSLGCALRSVHLLLGNMWWCRSGTICDPLVFEPSNILLIFAFLLSNTLWKRIGTLFDRGKTGRLPSNKR